MLDVVEEAVLLSEAAGLGMGDRRGCVGHKSFLENRQMAAPTAAAKYARA